MKKKNKTILNIKLTEIIDQMFMDIGMTIHIKRIWNCPASSTTHKEGRIHAKAQFFTEEEKNNSKMKVDKQTIWKEYRIKVTGLAPIVI